VDRTRDPPDLRPFPTRRSSDLKADQTYQLTQRERIALGLLAQHDALTARELATSLELPSVEALQPWLKRLLDWQLVQSAGRTQRSEEHTSELQSRENLVCRLLL